MTFLSLVPRVTALTALTLAFHWFRDMFYDGRVKMEQGAVVLRLAPTWFRSVVTTKVSEFFI